VVRLLLEGKFVKLQHALVLRAERTRGEEERRRRGEEDINERKNKKEKAERTGSFRILP
jgi:hypothetical protein